eukprot:3941433-Rhodomonas_salina.2
MRCPVPSQGPIRISFAMSGTDRSYEHIGITLCLRYAMSGTEVGSYTFAAQCPVLSSGMLLPDSPAG